MSWSMNGARTLICIVSPKDACLFALFFIFILICNCKPYLAIFCWKKSNSISLFASFLPLMQIMAVAFCQYNKSSDSWHSCSRCQRKEKPLLREVPLSEMLIEMTYTNGQMFQVVVKHGNLLIWQDMFFCLVTEN